MPETVNNPAPSPCPACHKSPDKRHRGERYLHHWWIYQRWGARALREHLAAEYPRTLGADPAALEARMKLFAEMHRIFSDEYKPDKSHYLPGEAFALAVKKFPLPRKVLPEVRPTGIERSQPKENVPF